ncbi:MAG TPA: hypothetical protein VNT26_20855 [Candidatus Sulfotelmatobacter sp.]|nr:hypothetical protein [Candidatus Sulfotelmatobacter sp.]
MPTDVAKKVTPAQVLEDLARLPARQFEKVLEQAAQLRLQKRKRVLPTQESELLRIINRGLSTPKSQRLEQLQEKLRQETLKPREHQQLLRLTDELERLAADRLKALMDLAALRKTSVAKLMQQMGLNEAAYG